MIELKTLTANDKGKRVIYRGIANAGPPEYGTIVAWDDRKITIIVDGDRTTTTVRANEITWINP